MKGALPSFLVIGAAKTGTTSLYEYLRAHPQVAMSTGKEPSFFSDERRWRKGLGWYRGFFPDAGPEVAAVGEASVRYTYYPVVRGVPERIRSVLPHVRLIYLVRHPIERIRSMYVHGLQLGWEALPFERAIEEHQLYLASSLYWMQLGRYLRCFDRSRILVLRSEDLRTAREGTFRRVCDFLEVDPGATGIPLTEEHNRADVRRRVPRSERLWRIRNTPAVGRVRGRGPRPVRAAVSRALSTGSPRPVDVQVTPPIAARLLRALRWDTRRLGEFLEQDLSPWETWPPPGPTSSSTR